MERTKRRGKPFLEIFSSTLQEDYRFPILELFAFLYTLGTFIFVSFQTYGGVTDEQATYMVVTSLMGFPMFIFTILIFKNVAYGLGNDLEKGTIQTSFSYPLKRRSILTAKLLSAIAVALNISWNTNLSTLSACTRHNLQLHRHGASNLFSKHRLSALINSCFAADDSKG